MLLIIDNYDSFTYNLVQYFGELQQAVKVVRNDQHRLAEIAALSPSRLVISPGPSNPDNAGISLAAIEYFAGKIPIFGVCLGHQCIGQVFGGRVIRAKQLMHGKTSAINHRGTGLFSDLPVPFSATRYHSLAVESHNLPDCLTITAQTEDGEIMGIQHRELAIVGVQFHPESLLSEHGHKMLENFLHLNN